MADPYSPTVPGIPQDGELSPDLQHAAGAFNTDDGKDWSADILSRVQQHINMVQVSDANAVAGQHLVNSYNTVKGNLLGMVQDDPTAASLAVDIAPKLLAPLFGHMDGEQGPAAHADATSALQTEIAHTAVMRMADFHQGAAHALMDQLSDHIGDEDARKSLGDYIDTLQIARNADNAASSQQLGVQQLRASGLAAYQYGRGLLDPKTEEVSFPRDYMSNLVRNPSIQPADKEALFLAHGNLATLGDTPQSNPFVVNQLVNRMAQGDDPSHKELMQHVGTDLKYADALMLHGLTTTRTPEFDGHINDLSAILNDARSKLVDGSRAGDAAYSRFVDWFLPSYRRTGTDGLNPKADSYLFGNTSLANFSPRSSDLVRPTTGQRRPLSEIFRG